MIAALQSDDNDKRHKWKKDIKNDKCFKRIEKEIIKRNSWHRKIGLFVTLYYGTDLLEWLVGVLKTWKLFSIRKSLTGQSQVYCCWRSIQFSKRTRLGLLHSANIYLALSCEQIRVEQNISQNISFLKVHLRFGWTSNGWLTRGKVARSLSVSAKSLQLSQTL